MIFRLITFILLQAFVSVSLAQDGNMKIRKMADTVGFASKDFQMDALMKYMEENEKKNIISAMKNAGADEVTAWKTAICPHDDYSYVGYLYPALLRNVKAKTVILIGVCHKAGKFGLEDKIIFDSYTHWKMPYGYVKVSTMRDEIIKRMNPEYCIIHDSVQAAEHSIEAIIPFLQYYNRDVQIISILVPYMPYNRMNEIAENLSEAVIKISSAGNLDWGGDLAIVISNDAVHYGDDDWGGNNYAPYGADTSGYKLAFGHEIEIIDDCLAGEVDKAKIKTFIGYTVKVDNYRDYKWTWCGRYSVPFGLLVTDYMQSRNNLQLNGYVLKYATSIDHPHIPVREFGMGVTAPANIRHWVGYAAIGYR